MTEFYRPKNLLSNFVLVNGTARCGKSLISPIIASFENVEIERMEGIFDFISVSYYFGKIDRNCAISMLRTVADEFVYASYLSRNTNFRWSDHSSVFKSPNRIKYIKRLFYHVYVSICDWVECARINSSFHIIVYCLLS